MGVPVCMGCVWILDGRLSNWNRASLRVLCVCALSGPGRGVTRGRGLPDYSGPTIGSFAVEAESLKAACGDGKGDRCLVLQRDSRPKQTSERLLVLTD